MLYVAYKRVKAYKLSAWSFDHVHDDINECCWSSVYNTDTHASEASLPQRGSLGWGGDHQRTSSWREKCPADFKDCNLANTFTRHVLIFP
jgi:hypothetical protein